MSSPVELVATYWTMGGDCRPGGGPGEISSFDFRDRVEMARKVGYCGIGLAYADIMAVSEHMGLDAMRTILDDNGMKYVEVENIGDWFADGERRKRSDVQRRGLMNAAEKLGAWHIKIGGDIENDGAKDWPMDKMIEDFRVLCDQAADVGTRISLELMPFTNLRTIDQGLELVRGAGADNGGIMLDIWHMERGNIDFERIAEMPGETIFWVELNDAKAEVEGSLFNDTINCRVLPGEGAFDTQGFLSALRRAGYNGPYGVEILSSDHRRLPLAEQATRPYEATMKQFEIFEQNTIVDVR